jgi:integrase
MWVLFEESQKGSKRWVIRRWNGKRYERLPVGKYKRIREDHAALSEFVTRLNASAEAKARKSVEIKHAFISPALLERYQLHLTAQIPSAQGARQEYSYLYRYFLLFFIGKLNLQNPLDWYRAHKIEWASYLLSKECPASAKSKRDIVIAANRFIEWLHEERPEEVPPLTFKPLTKARYEELEAQRELDGKKKETKYIPPAHWQKIDEALTADIAPHVRLLYHYGLRRNEGLGLKPGDVRNNYLLVERQQPRLSVYTPVKGRLKRKVPHWFCKAAEAYGWIDKAEHMHPRTLSSRFEEVIRELQKKGKFKAHYTLHDLRHTFVTRALREQAPVDVQHAVGHKNILTTMGYQHDDRQLGDAPFKPAA